MKQFVILLTALFLMATTSSYAQHKKGSKVKIEHKKKHKKKGKHAHFKKYKHKHHAFVLPVHPSKEQAV